MLNKSYGTWPCYSKQEAEIVKKILLSNKVNQWTGKEVRNFEKNFSKYHKIKYSVAVSNGSVALDLALKSLNLKKNSEVIVTPRSFVASATCILNNNLIPKFCDVDYETGNICPKDLEHKITKKTKAVIIVHLAGFPCNMKEIIKLKKKYNFFLIEDCSQSHGAKYNNKHTGSFGDIATWSFCQDKIMTTGGEGGMVSTKSKKIYDFINSFKDHGKNFKKIDKKNNSSGFKWLHDNIGSNYRMTEMQAALGSFQLKKLDSWVISRNQNAKKILNECKKYPLIYDVRQVPKNIRHSYYKLIINLAPHIKKKKLFKYILGLYEKYNLPILTGPCPEIYREKVFNKFKIKRLNNAKKLSQNCLMFFVHPSLKKKDLTKIKDIINKVSLNLMKKINVK